VRIVAGTFRGRRLQAVPGQHTRPTADRVRESVFNILGDGVVGARVLDLFAGTGALALEAISRGAVQALCIDNHPAALAAIRANIDQLAVADRVRIMRWDLTGEMRRLALGAIPFDLVFMDPPYAAGLLDKTLTRLAASGALAPDALVVVEHGHRSSAPSAHPDYMPVDARRYGKTLVSFLRYVV